jgi:hypothetical protein
VSPACFLPILCLLLAYFVPVSCPPFTCLLTVACLFLALPLALSLDCHLLVSYHPLPLPQAARELASMFGEDPKKCSLEEIFAIFAEFQREFERTRAANIKHEEDVKKEADREELLAAKVSLPAAFAVALLCFYLNAAT